jgi:hypothetical protein
LHGTPEGDRHALAASDFRQLWDDLMTQLKRIPWRAKRDEYRAAKQMGREAILAELFEELNSILQGFWASYQGPGRHPLAYCGLTGKFPSDHTLHEIAQKALTVPTGRNPRDTIGYEFLGRLKFNIGGWEMLNEWPPRSASPSLIKSTMATLRKRQRRR